MTTMSDPWLGKRIGNFMVDAFLGEGSYGTVYKGHHVRLASQRVAIKLLRPEFSHSPRFLQAFQKECNVIAELNAHPGIVDLVEPHLDEEPRGVILEYLDGQDLRAILLNGPLPWEVVAHVFSQALDALAFAHGMGIVHRDIKPANLFLCNLPNPYTLKLVDFGLAKCLENAGGSMSHEIKGTPYYMALEQWQGTASRASDVYSIGLVGWEMLAGKTACPDLPYAAILMWLLREGPAPIRTVAPDCPPWFADVIDLFCQVHTENRPIDALAARELFETARDHGVDGELWQAAIRQAQVPPSDSGTSIPNVFSSRPGPISGSPPLRDVVPRFPGAPQRSPRLTPVGLEVATPGLSAAESSSPTMTLTRGQSRGMWALVGMAAVTALAAMLFWVQPEVSPSVGEEDVPPVVVTPPPPDDATPPPDEDVVPKPDPPKPDPPKPDPPKSDIFKTDPPKPAVVPEVVTEPLPSVSLLVISDPEFDNAVVKVMSEETGGIKKSYNISRANARIDVSEGMTKFEFNELGRGWTVKCTKTVPSTTRKVLFNSTEDDCTLR